MDKSIQITQWICKRCGSVHESKLLAEGCFSNHVGIDNLGISNVALHEGGSVYQPGIRFPSIIEIEDTSTNIKELYVLNKLIATPGNKPTVARRGVKLED